MIELDVEALKQLVHVAEGDCPTPPGERKDCPRCQAVDQLKAIVLAFNALEDRDRLRSALDEILTANESELRQIARAALEAHND